jgi:membrane protease YdiL (CAAX protease family)
VWATPLASFAVPEGGVIDPIIQFLIFVGIFTVWFALGEEIGMRGYLQPRLMSLGRNRALFLVGLVWATWHMPLIFLAPAVAFRTGNLLFFPLFYGTILRLPKDLHRQRVACLNRTLCAQRRVEHPESVHPDNGISCVGERLPGGDFGLLILIGVVIGAIWVGHRFKGALDEAQSGAEIPTVAPAQPSAPAALR